MGRKCRLRYTRIEKIMTTRKSCVKYNYVAPLKSKTTQNFTNKIKLLNRFETKSADSQNKKLNKYIETLSKKNSKG